MYLRRFLFTLFALALAPPGFAQSLAKNFTLNGANQCATIGVSDLATVGITVTGTFSATLQPEVSIAGQSPGNTQVTPTTSNTAQATITTTGNYVAAVAGFDTFLLCVSSYASGTANVYLNPSGAVNASVIGGGGGGLAWNLLTNATGNMSIQNGTHTTTFQQTAAEPWLWANTTPATSSTPQDSPIWELEGTWWGASLASAVDGWTIEDVPGASTTMVSGKTSTASETSGVVTIAGTGMTVFPNNQSGYLGVGAVVTFQGFTTLTWLNGVPVSLITNSSSSITFDDPTNHANQGSIAETTVTASAAESDLNLAQIAGSAPVGKVQLINPAAATATSVNTSPEFDFVTNSWNTSSQTVPFRIYSKGGTGGGVLPTLVIDRVNTGSWAGGGGGIILGGSGSSAQSDPQLTFDHDNLGVLSDDGQIGFEPSDGVTYNQTFEFFTSIVNTSAGFVGNEGSVAGADVDIGANGLNRTNVTGPNYGVVIAGIGATGLGHEIFSPASGSSANYSVVTGGEFNPAAGSTTFTGVYVAPVITGTTSGKTSAFTVAPTTTNTHLTGTNLVADFQSAPGTDVASVDYAGLNAALYRTLTVCSASGTAVNPSVVTCGAAAAGLVYCDVAASAGTCTVNTSAVTANSSIQITPNGADGTTLSKTCNTAPTVVPFAILASKSAGTSFTINMPTLTVNGACFEYSIVN